MFEDDGGFHRRETANDEFDNSQTDKQALKQFVGEDNTEVEVENPEEYDDDEDYRPFDEEEEDEDNYPDDVDSTEESNDPA